MRWILLIGLAQQSISQAAPLDANKRAEICAEIQRLGNLGTLDQVKLAGDAMSTEALAEFNGLDQGTIVVYRGEWIDIDGDGAPEPWGYSTGGGTCSTNIVVPLQPTRPLGPIMRTFKGWSPEEIENDDALRWSTRGTLEGFYRVLNVPVIVAVGPGSSPRLAMLADDDERLPLCAFEQLENPRFSIVESHDAALCTDVASGATKPLELAIDFAQPQTKVDYLGLFVQGGPGMRVDLDNDGDQELIREFTYHSGAGCGSRHYWLTEVDAVGFPLDTPLSALLSPASPQSRYERAESSGQLFAHLGGVHLFGQLGSDFGVFTIAEGAVRTQCRFRAIPQVELSRLY